ncbi:Myc-type, basic helix-loop-helix (bHLH) domain protein [Kalmanozyma brasiliensis GHG001]|uniref:BHLH domain-containing protein n=1 Tax=Kalmanozyma brasiliensis (strain GHG001) TaxID=1365824 RepID=V5EZI9_KALBG|nr:Myc-type, basic helix-loop-helix (bHLH) domain protein [Kalmanozyma brasiliensis GHG001]EST08294.1 Myc-type, basic helix-loop-helix (bHLH) domain protein [Kalmanozyma brasiliensis GHG001]
MLYSSYRPALAPGAEPNYDRGYAEDYHFHQRHASHPGPTSLSAPTDPSTYISASSDRFESKGQTLIASLLESRLFSNALVRDCSVIGVSQPAGAVVTSSRGQMPIAGTAPIAFVALSSTGRERSAHGGDKESKRMKNELIKYIVDFAPPFKLMKGKLIFVESIPRGPDGSVLRHLLVEKATTPPAPGPDKGFFNTVLSEPSTPAGPSKAGSVVGDSETAGTPKKGVRDSKRRATHSQIERRRREKINDRLVTLRSIVPACARELEDRRRQKQEEEDEAARIAAGGAPKTYIDAATGKPKRKRNRKKPDPKKSAGADKEEELGLHKLEVLTHAINYIFELKGYIQKLETGAAPEHVPTADNPFGVRNKDGTYRQDAKIEDEPGCGAAARQLGSEDVHFTVGALEAKSTRIKRDDDEEDEVEEEEEDQIEDDVAEGDDEGEAQAAELEEDDEDDDDEPLERRSKKHMTAAAFRPHPSLAKTGSFVAPSRYIRTDTTYSSSSSRDSVEVSPAFSFIQQSPMAISPATTITSPMMSLSAESPIMLPDPAISMPKRGVSSAARVSQAATFASLPASALPLPPGQPGRRESSSFLFKQLSLASPNFAPFNGSSYVAAPASSAAAAAAAAGSARARSSTLSFPTTYGEESELRDTSAHKTPGLSDRDTTAAGPSDASAAALLLNFSTSPEVLRPIGRSSTTAHRTASVASSPHTRPVVGLPSNKSRSTFSSPHYRPSMYSSKLGTPASAAMAAIEEPEPLDLASPPHLALDSGSQDEEIDQLSERTVDELPAELIKTEKEEEPGQAVEMDTAA